MYNTFWMYFLALLMNIGYFDESDLKGLQTIRQFLNVVKTAT